MTKLSGKNLQSMLGGLLKKKAAKEGQPDNGVAAPAPAAEVKPAKKGFDFNKVLKADLNAIFKKKKEEAAGRAAAEASQLAFEGGDLPRAKARKFDFDGMHGVTIGRKSYAVGLFWMPATGQKPVEIAASIGSSSYNLVVDYQARGQIGFGATDDALKLGMIPAIFSYNPAHMGNNWIAAVQLDQMNWWVGIVRDGIALDDVVVKNSSQAQEVFMGTLDDGAWDRIICPAGWEIPGSFEADVVDILTKPSPKKLKSLRPIKDNLPKIIIGGFMLAAATTGYVWYENKKAAEEEERARIAALEAQRIRLIPSQFPWARSTPIVDFVAQCEREIERSRLIAPYWEQRVISCFIGEDKKGQIQANISADRQAKAAHLELALEVNNALGHEAEGEISFARNLGSAVYTRSFTPPVDEESQQQKAWAADFVNHTLTRRFQAVGVEAELRSNIERVSPSQMRARRAPIFNNHDVTIKTGFALHEIAELVADIPAIVPRELVYSPAQEGWTLKFTVFHTPITK